MTHLRYHERMLQSLYIKNFRAFDEVTLTFDGKDAVLIGENGAGKASVLQALQCFFNRTSIPHAFVRNARKPVEIGVRYNGRFYKRVFSGKNHELDEQTAEPGLEEIRFAYLPSTTNIAGVMLALDSGLLEKANYSSLILGVDKAENAFEPLELASVLPELQKRIGQLIMSTASSEVAAVRGEAQIVPIGPAPKENTVKVLKEALSKTRTYLLVEGKYDLPWFKTALKLLGATKRFYVLPSGGSNLNELRKALGSASLPCLAIVDGDTPPIPKKRVFALRRDCIELYAPEELLTELYGIVPPITSKDDFFGAIQEVRPKTSRDGVKDAIAERISEFLTPESAFVREVNEIISTK